MSKKIIECHECDAEITIVDKYSDIDLKNIQYCPLCGTNNIEKHEKA